MSLMNDVASTARILDEAPYKLLDALGYDAYRSVCQDLQWMSWPQGWGNTGCGFPGISGQAMTVAQTMLVGLEGGPWAVYHGGRWAYTVKRPSDKFTEDMYQQRLKGKMDFRAAVYERS